VVKIGPDGTWIKAVGTYGDIPHGISADADGNVYVANRSDGRIQIYNNDLNFKSTITGMGLPWSVQVMLHQRQKSGIV